MATRSSLRLPDMLWRPRLRSWWSQKPTSSREARADSPARLAALCSSAPCELRRLRLSQPPRSPERSTWATNHFRGAGVRWSPRLMLAPFNTRAENQHLLLETQAGGVTHGELTRISVIRIMCSAQGQPVRYLRGIHGASQGRSRNGGDARRDGRKSSDTGPNKRPNDRATPLVQGGPGLWGI